jgi:hypothetical protein
MTEIEKLRHRLRNVGKNVTEYRMTVVEARGLLIEIDRLMIKQEKPQDEVVLNEPAVINRIIDGGAF